MEFTLQECTRIVLLYGECLGNANLTHRTYADRYRGQRVPSVRGILNVMNRFCETGNAMGRPQGAGGGGWNAREPDQRVLQAFEDDPTTSTREVAQRFGLTQKTVWKTLRDHGLHPYHYLRVQKLHPGDEQRRLAFCRWVLDQNENDPQFVHNVLWTDESTFGRCSNWNQRNNHQWAAENPRCIVENRTVQIRFKKMLWMGIIGNRVVRVCLICTIDGKE